MRRSILLSIAVCACCISVRAVAAVDVYLKIVGDDKIIAKTSTDVQGNFKFDGLAEGAYAISFRAGDKEYVCSGSGTNIVKVVATHESAKGRPGATGKHQPLKFDKEWGPGSPQLRVVVDGDTIRGILSRVSPSAAARR